MYNKNTWRKCHGMVYPSGSIDDYFPDYQSGCGLIILLNDRRAQESGVVPLFLLALQGLRLLFVL